MNREPIYAALFAKLAAVPGFVTMSRRLKHWNDCDKSIQPALYMAQTGESADTVRGQPTRWTLAVDVYVYARTDGELAPGPVINPLIDAIEQALAPNAIENAQTLGGLVEWCRVDGAIQTDEGTLGEQLVQIIPVLILVS